jgi:hypothetical protein
MKISMVTTVVGVLLTGLVIGFFAGTQWGTASEKATSQKYVELAMMTAASQLRANTLMLEVLERKDYESARVAAKGSVDVLYVMLSGQAPDLSPAGRALVDEAIRESLKYRDKPG